ncbi:MAG: hypothetical protein O2783_02410 [Chloroflexi bacterium]|nr:hypothetical protein [Chloroflexota bacterium]
MLWADWNKALTIGIDAFIVVLTVFFILMIAFDAVESPFLKDDSAQIALQCAIGLSVLLPTRFIISVKNGRYE